MFSLIFVSTLGYTMSKNLLLVTNNGWYFNDKYIQTLSEVKVELNKISKSQLEFVSCSQTEYDTVVETLDIVYALKFNTLNLNSDYLSPHCN